MLQAFDAMKMLTSLLPGLQMRYSQGAKMFSVPSYRGTNREAGSSLQCAETGGPYHYLLWSETCGHTSQLGDRCLIQITSDCRAGGGREGMLVFLYLEMLHVNLRILFPSCTNASFTCSECVLVLFVPLFYLQRITLK